MENTPHVEGGSVPPLMAMSIESARELKWQKGRQEHGDLMMLDPLEEAYHEELDLINYCRSALLEDKGLTAFERQEIRVILAGSTSAAETLRKIRLAHPERHYSPTVYPFK